MGNNSILTKTKTIHAKTKYTVGTLASDICSNLKKAIQSKAESLTLNPSTSYNIQKHSQQL